MTHSRPFRILFLATMFASMAVVLAWAGWIGRRPWPEWRAVREMRAAVEANEPGRFLDAIEQVDSLGVAEAAADEIAPLRQHPDPRVRMVAVMARTVLGPRGPAETKELIKLFEDPDEDIDVRQAAAFCLVLFGEQAREAVPSLRKAMNVSDPRHRSALVAFSQLGRDVTGPSPLLNYGFPFSRVNPLGQNATRREMIRLLWDDAGAVRHAAAVFRGSVQTKQSAIDGQGSN